MYLTIMLMHMVHYVTVTYILILVAILFFPLFMAVGTTPFVTLKTYASVMYMNMNDDVTVTYILKL